MKFTEQELMSKVTLAQIQAEVRAPKGKYNSFGKYHYRSAEDIMEAVKPIINQYGFWLMVSDSIELIGTRYYVKSTATLTNGESAYVVTAFAREDETRKGMDVAMLTGATASYARKYALQGLFALDQNKDIDEINDGKTESVHPEWEAEVGACKTIDELMRLYNSNKEAVESNSELKKLFAERKKQIA